MYTLTQNLVNLQTYRKRFMLSFPYAVIKPEVIALVAAITHELISLRAFYIKHTSSSLHDC
jgi:hypothetical protein